MIDTITSLSGQPFNKTTNKPIDQYSIGRNNGVAGLDANAKIPSSFLPSVALSQVFTVSSQAAMLALPADVGNFAIRTDVNKTFILRTVDASILSNWQELPSSVVSVNGKSGTVILNKSDIALSNVDNTSDLNKPISTATQNALDVKFNLTGGAISGNITASNLSGTNTGDETQSTILTKIGYTPENITNKDTDSTLSANSDSKYPSQKAIKTYVDSLAANAINYKGGYNASTNTYPSGTIKKGDLFIISVAGTLGGNPIQVGDYIIANIDNPGQTSSNWNSLNTNIAYTPEDSANKGQPSGYASLDSGGKVPSSQLPAISGNVSSVNGQTGAVNLTTTNINEGTNLYYSQSRFDTAFGSKNTSNLAEGTNQYFTASRVLNTQVDSTSTNQTAITNTDTVSLVLTKLRNLVFGRQAKQYVVVGSDWYCDYVTDGVDDHVQVQQAVDFVATQGGGTVYLKKGNYFFGDTVRIKTPNTCITGSDKNEVTITCQSGFTVWTGALKVIQGGLFSFFDPTGADTALSNCQIKNISINFNQQDVGGVLFRTPVGNTTTNVLTLDNITQDSLIGNVTAGYDILYGFVENYSSNSTYIGLGNTPAKNSSTTTNNVNTNFTVLSFLKFGYLPDSIVITNNTATQAQFKIQSGADFFDSFVDMTNTITLAGNATVTLRRADFFPVTHQNEQSRIRIINAGTGFTSTNLNITVNTRKVFREYHKELLVPGIPATVTINNVTSANTFLATLPKDTYIKDIKFTNNTSNVVIVGIDDGTTGVISGFTIGGSVSNVSATPSYYNSSTPAWSDRKLYIRSSNFNSANINVTITFGSKAIIRPEFINEILPFATNTPIYINNSSADWNGASLKINLQTGKVVKNFTVENMRFTGYIPRLDGCIHILGGKTTAGQFAYSKISGIKILNCEFLDNYYPGLTTVLASRNNTSNLYIDSNNAYDVVIRGNMFKNTYGNSIRCFSENTVWGYRARKHWRIESNSFIRTKLGVFHPPSYPRKYDFGDDIRMGFVDIIFDKNYVMESADSKYGQMNYENFTDNATGPEYTTSDYGDINAFASVFMIMNTDGAIFTNNVFRNCKTPLDIGYDNPSGNECYNILIQANKLINCSEMGDLDGHYNVMYKDNYFEGISHVPCIDGYGECFLKTWDGNQFINCGELLSPGFAYRALFFVRRSGQVFINNTIRYTKQPPVVDYIFWEQHSNQSEPEPTSPITYRPLIYMNNVIVGIEPRVATFALNQAQTHIIDGNYGVKGNINEAIVVGFNTTPSAPTPMLGVARNNYAFDGTVLNDRQETLISGTNIKTINGNSVLGSGNIDITNLNQSNIVNGYVDLISNQSIAGIKTLTDNIIRSGNTGTNRSIQFISANAGNPLRAAIKLDNTSESGASAGSSFSMETYDDDGVTLRAFLRLNRVLSASTPSLTAQTNGIDFGGGHRISLTGGGSGLAVQAQGTVSLVASGNDAANGSATTVLSARNTVSTIIQAGTTPTTAQSIELRTLSTNGGTTQVTRIKIDPITGLITAFGPLQFNGATNSGITVNSLTTTQRDALTAPANGTLIYNTTTNKFQFRENSAWVDLGTGLGGASWGAITGTLSSQTDLQTALNAKENLITAGTTSQYWRGDKTFQTLDKTAVGLSNVVNLDTSDPANISQSASYRFVTDTEKGVWNGKQNALGFTAENVANKSTSVLLGTSNTLYPTQNAVKDYVDNPFQWQPKDYGYLSWGFDVAMCSAATAITAGLLQVVKLRVPRAITVGNVYFNLNTVGSGLANCYCALYQANTLVAQSTDQATNWGTGTGLKQTPIGPVNLSAGTVDVVFWIGSFTTSPNFCRSGNVAGQNGFLAGEDLRWSTANSGITTIAPTNLGVRLGINNTWWVALGV